MATASAGIFQSDLIIQTGISGGLDDLRRQPWLLDYIFVSLAQDGLTYKKYGKRQMDEARRWIEGNEVPVFVATVNPPQLPAITIALLESAEVEREGTTGDVHHEPEEPAEGIGASIGPFVPTSYDQATGILGLPTEIADGAYVSSTMQVSDAAGRAHRILSVGDGTISIEPGTNLDFSRASILYGPPSHAVSLESSSFKETFLIGVHVQGPPLYGLILHHALVFCLLRYKQSLFEARGFERSTFSSSDFQRNGALETEPTYSRYVTLSGNVRQHWPKDVALRAQLVQLRGLAIVGSGNLPPEVDPNEATWIGDQDSLSPIRR